MSRRVVSILMVVIMILSGFSVLFGTTAGEFENHLVREFPIQDEEPQVMVIGDVNNDGYNDTIVLFRENNNFSLYLNDGFGNLDLEDSDYYSVPQKYSPTNIALGDVNNDGLLDVLVIDRNTNNLTIFNNSATGWVYDDNFISGDANAQIIEMPYDTWPGHYGEATEVLVADLNDDGLNDTVIGQMSQGSGGFTGFHVMLHSNNQFLYDNDSDPYNFNPFLKQYASGAYVFDIAIADVGEDSNDDLDVIMSGYRYEYDMWGVSTYINQGNGIFTVGEFYTFDDKTVRVQPGDLNNDGDTDLLISTWSSSNNYFGVLYNDGAGRLFDNDKKVGNENLNFERYSVKGGIPALELGDIDLDNDLDIVILDNSQTITIFENDLTGRLFDSDTADNNVNDNRIEFVLEDFRSELLRLGNMDAQYGLDAVMLDRWTENVPYIVYVPLLGWDAGIWDMSLYNSTTKKEIDNPMSNVQTVGDYDLNVTVKNYGIYDITQPFSVSLTVINISNISVHYFINQTISSTIDHFHSINTTFNLALTEGTYMVIIQTWLPNDEFSLNYSDNNDMDEWPITILDFLDMGGIKIVEPGRNIPIGLTGLNVVLQNLGNYPAYDFNLNLTIYDLEYSTPVFSDDMEAGTGKWNATGGDPNNTWQQVTWESNSPTTSWWFGNDSQKDQSANFLNGSLKTLNQIDLSSLGFTPDTVVLKINHSYDFELDTSEFGDNNPEIHPIEGGWVSVSTDGVNWSTLQPEDGYPYKNFALGYSNQIGISDPSPYDGMGIGSKVNDFQGQEAFLTTSDGWVSSSFDVGAYLGSKIYIAFNYSGHNLRGVIPECEANGFINGSNGWWIDDVMVLPMNLTYNWSVDNQIAMCDAGETTTETFGGAQWNASKAGEYIAVAKLNYTDDEEPNNNISSKNILVENINDVASLGLAKPAGCSPPGNYNLNGVVANPGNVKNTFPVNFSIEKYNYISEEFIYFNNIDDPATGSQSPNIGMNFGGGWFTDNVESWSKSRSLYCAESNDRVYGDHWDEYGEFGPLNLSGMTNERVVVSFFQKSNISTGNSGQVIITNENNDFSDALYTTTGVSVGWEYVQVDLSDYNGYANLSLMFYFTSDEEEDGPGWHIDDINITASTYTLIPQWSDEVIVTDLGSGEKYTAVSGLVWSPAIEGDYLINITTKLANDEDNSNNMTSEVVTIKNLLDATIKKINPGTMETMQYSDDPAFRALAGTAQSFDATVQNNGNTEQTFDVNCSIYLENWQTVESILYNDTYNATSGSQAGSISIVTTGDWRINDTRASTGATSWWCGNDLGGHDYENDTTSSLGITNIDLSGIEQNNGVYNVAMSFDFWFDLADNNDMIWVNASAGAQSQTLWFASGGGQSWGWQKDQYFYLPWFMLGNAKGAIYFNFTSNSSLNAEGVYIDNINITKEYKWEAAWWDEKMVTISAGDAKDVKFKPWMVQETPPDSQWDSDALIVVSTQLQGDLNNENNQSKVQVYMYNIHDFGVQSINAPLNGWVPQGLQYVNTTFANDGTTAEKFNGSIRISSNTTTEPPFDIMNDCSNITQDWGQDISYNVTTYQFDGDTRWVSSYLRSSNDGPSGKSWTFENNGIDSSKCFELSQSATGQVSYWEQPGENVFDAILSIEGLAPWSKYMELSFWHNYSISEGFDSGVLILQPDNGNSIQLFSSPGYTGTAFSPNNKGNDMPGWTGDSGGWVKETLNLTDYIGYKRLTLIFRFYLDTLNSDGSYWALDDLNLRMISGTLIEEDYGFYQGDSGLAEQTTADADYYTFSFLGPGDYYIDAWADYYRDEWYNLRFDHDDTPGNDLMRRYIKTDDIAPSADAGNEATINENTLHNLDGTGSSDAQTYITNYTWTFDDQGPKTLYDGSPDYYFANPGNFTVTLKVTDSSGLFDTDTVQINVADITSPLADAGDDITQDEDTWVAFDGSGSSDNKPGGSINLTWNFTDHGTPIVLYGTAPMYLFTNPGNYSVTLWVADDANNVKDDYVMVNINDITAPTADAGDDIETDEDVEVTFDGTGSADNDLDHAITYGWSFTDQGTPVALSGVSPKYTFDTPGIYTVTLTVKDYWAQLSHTDTVIVTVSDVTDPVAKAGSDQEVDEDRLVKLNANQTSDNNPSGTLGYTWTFYDPAKNDVIILNDMESQYTFTHPGEYTITLQVIDQGGNWANDTLIVTVRDTTAPRIIGLGNVGLDQGTKHTLDASSCIDPEGGTIKSYKWTIVESSQKTGLEGVKVDYTFNTAGIIKVTLNITDTRGSNWNSTTFDITVTGAILEVTSHYPILLKDVPVDTIISVTFNKEVDQTNCQEAFSIEPTLTGKFSWDKNTMTFTPDGSLDYGTVYDVMISTIAADLYGDSLQEDYTFRFTTEPSTDDTTAPTVTDWSPTTSQVSLDTIIEITFSETMDYSSVEGAFSILPDIDGKFSWAGAILIFTPTDDLSYDTLYTISISSKGADLSGNLMKDTFKFKFLTEPKPGVTRPTLTAVKPVPASTSISIETQIKYTFDITIDPNDFSLMLLWSGGTVDTTSDYDSANYTLTFTPKQALKYNTTYTTQLTNLGGNLDITANGVSVDGSYSFTTVKLGDIPEDSGELAIIVEDNGKRISGAAVTVMLGDKEVASGFTDESGEFLTNLPPGTYSVIIEHEDYLKETLTTIIIDEGATTSLDAPLSSVPTEKDEKKDEQDSSGALIGAIIAVLVIIIILAVLLMMKKKPAQAKGGAKKKMDEEEDYEQEIDEDEDDEDDDDDDDDNDGESLSKAGMLKKAKGK